MIWKRASTSSPNITSVKCRRPAASRNRMSPGAVVSESSSSMLEIASASSFNWKLPSKDLFWLEKVALFQNQIHIQSARSPWLLCKRFFCESPCQNMLEQIITSNMVLWQRQDDNSIPYTSMYVLKLSFILQSQGGKKSCESSPKKNRKMKLGKSFLASSGSAWVAKCYDPWVLCWCWCPHVQHANPPLFQWWPGHSPHSDRVSAVRFRKETLPNGSAHLGVFNSNHSGIQEFLPLEKDSFSQLALAIKRSLLLNLVLLRLLFLVLIGW